MMAEKGLNDGSRGGMDHASRRKKYCIATERGMHRDAEKGLFRAETMSCGAESYE